ncbi:MAG TPA: peptidyl-prolyl cis-trans isomerase [Burkholderiales bacterium]|nr:peptidyl-prolyl cis-trans isomerase [Burkholderiales bacterium]
MRRALITAAIAMSAVAAAAEGEFASVDGTSISAAEFEAARANAVRQKFYHREVPEAKLDEFGREVAQALIDRVLLQAEIRRRGLVPDEARVRAEIAQYESRYAQSERWQKNRAALLPGLERMLGEREVLERLQAAVRDPGAVSDAELERYYEAHKGLFTEPEQARLSVIVLKVDPSAPAASWAAAEDEARAIRKRIAAGADFAEAARMHSADASAANGGDLGYLHQGMMPESLYEKLGSMKPGELSEPLRLLEGVALFRLTERREARLRPFAEVKERAAQLRRRDEGERRWAEFLARLRAAATIRIDTERYPALASMAGAGSGSR